MGGFHATCIFVAVISKRFSDGGLKDIIVEVDLLGSVTVEKVLRGKHYNYGLRVLKYVYEALQRIKIDAFEDWLRGKKRMSLYRRFVESKEFDNLCTQWTYKNFEACKRKFIDVFRLLEEFEEVLADKQSNPMSAYWLSFLELVQILLDFVKSIRQGNWDLHLNAAERMIP